MEILRIQNLTKKYGSNIVVNNLNLSVERGEFITLLGPSGCGKTTTLRMIAGFETPDAGSIILNGNDITKLPPYQRQVNTVFQNYALFPHMTVEENVAFGLKQQKKSSADIKAKVTEMLEMVRMKSFAKRKPAELSGGQQQRIAIARAVACDPDILLLDEPLGALDLKLRKAMQFELKSLQKSLNKTFIYVTHDQEEALTMSDRVAVMNGGVLDQLADCHSIYYQPKTPFVAEFIGDVNVVKGKLKDGMLMTAENLILPASSSNVTGAVALYIRPENISFTSDEVSASAKGIVSDVIFAGMFRKYKVKLSENISLMVSETTLSSEHHSVGDRVFLKWNPESTVVFGES